MKWLQKQKDDFAGLGKVIKRIIKEILSSSERSKSLMFAQKVKPVGGLCSSCGQPGHSSSNCPAMPKTNPSQTQTTTKKRWWKFGKN